MSIFIIKLLMVKAQLWFGPTITAQPVKPIEFDRQSDSYERTVSNHHSVEIGY